jgi:hypothetical protein
MTSSMARLKVAMRLRTPFKGDTVIMVQLLCGYASRCRPVG